MMHATTTAAPKKIHVIQGEHHISGDDEVTLSTVLGSCVAACVYDPKAKVGGMNHFLLADSDNRTGTDAVRYGAYAMELLINGLLKKGADRSRLQAKVFGGARMFDGLSDVGADNARFIRKFLADEGIPLLSESLGGTAARRVEFWPTSGRARLRFTGGNEVEERRAPPRPVKPADDGDVELF